MSAFDGDRTIPFGTFPADAAAMMNLSEIFVRTRDAFGAEISLDLDAPRADRLLPLLGRRPV